MSSVTRSATCPFIDVDAALYEELLCNVLGVCPSFFLHPFKKDDYSLILLNVVKYVSAEYSS